MQRDNVYLFMMQTALQNARPSGLPSNLVIQQFGAPYDQIPLQDDLQATVLDVGYPYGYGEEVTAAQGTLGNTALVGNSATLYAYPTSLMLFGTLI